MKKISALSLLAIALVTSGCAFRSQTVGMAMDHNDFVAETTNGQTVLNILRAREREPMHFTSFSKVSGNVTFTAGASTNVVSNGNGGSTQLTTTTATKTGAGNASIDQTGTLQELVGTTLGATNISPQISLQVNSGTNFDIAINANDEFYKGILGTLPNSLLVHYLRQGFPADLLSHLTIGKLEFYAEVYPATAQTQDSTTLTKRIFLSDAPNTPDETENVKKFVDAIQCRYLSYAIDKDKPRTLPLASPDALSGLAPELVARLRSSSASGSYSYEAPKAEFKIALSEPASSDECESIRETLVSDFKQKFVAEDYFESSGNSTDKPTPQLGKLLNKASDFQRSGLIDREALAGQGGATFESVGFFNEQLKDDYVGNLVIEISFRSIEGVIYYLGEYARNDEPKPRLKSSTCADGGYCLPIIRLSEASKIEPDRRWVTVNYRGKRYAVPLSGKNMDDFGGRSSQTISLVQQLLNLTKTAKDLPSTPSVRIVN
jgi:hypothetical protein